MLRVTAGVHGFRSFWHWCGTNADFAVDPAQGSAPCLPVLPTTPARMGRDYVRHGTTSLFAALDIPAGR